MFVLARAVTYATLFMGFTLVFLPMRVLAWSGIEAPALFGGMQVAGIVTLMAGLLLTVSCILAFVFVGKGTPFPIDPPRRLVVRGPYTIIRNPMYIGAALGISGAAMYYGSWWLLGYAALFLTIAHAFVVVYEEPTLREMFGDDYGHYCSNVNRWLPH